MNNFSYLHLQKLIRERLNGYNLIVEGGIGVNPARYKYFREHGYTGIYVAIDSDRDLPSRIEIPSGMSFIIGDCFTSLINTDGKNSLFFSYGALSDCLLKERDVIEVIDVLDTYSAQFHMRPVVSGTEIYHPRMHRDGDTSNESYRRFQRFVDLSAERGWETEVVAKNLVFMEKQKTS